MRSGVFASNPRSHLPHNLITTFVLIALSGLISLGSTTMKKSTFTADVCEQTGLVIVDSGRLNSRPASKCTLCGHVMMNMLHRWQSHAKHCLLKFKGSKSAAARGVALSNGVAKPTAFQLQISAASEQHRKKLCDTYVPAFTNSGSLYRSWHDA